MFDYSTLNYDQIQSIIFNSRRNVIISYFLIPVIVFFTYGSTLRLGFFADDFYLLLNLDWNKILYVEGLSNKIIAKDFWYFRPIPLLSAQILKTITKDPFYWHLFNLILHSINGILVYNLLNHLLKNHITALLGSIAWVILPTSTEMVAWPVNQQHLWFGLFTLLFLIGCVKTKFWMALFSMIGALLSIETAFILFLITPLFFGRKGWTFWILSFCIMIIRFIFLGGVGNYGSNFLFNSINPLNWIIALGYYLKCIFLI